MIFWRQKVILSLLNKLPNYLASKTRLVKLSFLLKQEMQINEEGIFYDFFPYRYGPFSHTLNNDVQKLETMNLIKVLPEGIQAIPNTEGEGLASKMDAKIEAKIDYVITHYSNLPHKVLIDYVYDAHPWFASQNITVPSYHQFSKVAVHSINTIGYEGISIDSFLNTLLRANIKSVIDVRHNPYSRKFGFTADLLKEKLQGVKIAYHHFPSVGIPSSYRNNVPHDQELWSFYKDSILKNEATIVKKISVMCERQESALLCFERDPEDCHRSCLATQLKQINQLPIQHYRQEGDFWQ
jgi:hypothetical protein